jgi:pyruvate kinase
MVAHGPQVVLSGAARRRHAQASCPQAWLRHDGGLLPLAVRFPNRTKIVATLGPSSNSPEMIRSLMRAGVDVFRLNAAHSDHDSMAREIRSVRRIARQLRQGIGVLVDLQGPKIRVGPLEGAEPIWLKRGERLVISTIRDVTGRGSRGEQCARIGCGYSGLASDVRAGDRILLDDGNIELRTEGVRGTEIETTVVYGGLLKQFKGINVPGSRVSMRSLSRKDLTDLSVALAAGADFIAQSFVRSADDVRDLKRRIVAAGSDAQVIAKIERPEAVTELAAIVAAADGLMIARGDLGVELGAEAVPSLQKRIIRACNEACKPVITATQMLESMVTNPRPTRAEASDVANAIYDGTSAVMLSGETASGRHPLQAVQTMERITRETETDLFTQWQYLRRRRTPGAGSEAQSVAAATVRAAAYAALESDAKLIAVFTETGSTAELLSGERTPTRLIAFTPHDRTVQRLSLTWGVVARRVFRARTSHEMALEGERRLRATGVVKAGDRIVVVCGSIRARGMTNMMTIRSVE